MKIVKVSAIPMSAPVPEEKRHRTDLGTKVKSDATLIRVETDDGLTGIGAALGTPPIVTAIVEHELAAECVDEDPMFSERIYEKMYNVIAQQAGARAGHHPGRREPTPWRHHGSNCRHRYRGMGSRRKRSAFRSTRRWVLRAARCAVTQAAVGRRARRPRRNSRATPPRASPLPDARGRP